MRDIVVKYLFNKEIPANRKKTILFACVAFSLFLFGLGHRIIYQPDIYGRVSALTGDDLRSVLSNGDGRILTVLLIYFLHRGSFVFFYYISLVIGIILVSLTTYRFSILLIKEFQYVDGEEFKPISVVFISLISCITIANMFSSEFFLYIDMTVAFTLGIFCSVEAATLFIGSLHEEKPRIHWGIFVALLVVAFLYETISSVFIALTVPFILFYSGTFIDLIKKQVAAGIYYALPLFAKTVYTKFIVKSARAGFNRTSVVQSIQKYAPEGESPKVFIFDRITFGMWGYALLSIIVIVILIRFAIKKGRHIEIAKGLYLTAVIGIVGLVPYILRLTNDIRPRIYYPIGAFFGAMVIYGIMIGGFDINNIGWEKERVLFPAIIVVFISIQWLSFVQIYTESYVTNYEDKYISEIIGERIDEYEKETGKKVEYVAFYNDAIKTKYSMGGWRLIRRVYSSWNELQALNMYLGSDYKEGETDDEIAKYFFSRDWDCFSNEQILFRGDTAHICEY